MSVRVCRERVPEISVLEEREFEAFVINQKGKGTRGKEGRGREEERKRVALFTARTEQKT